MLPAATIAQEGSAPPPPPSAAPSAARAALEALTAVRVAAVRVGEQTFHVRTIGAGEAFEFREYAARDDVSGIQATYRIVRMTLSDEHGEPLLLPEEECLLARIPILELQEIAEAAVRHNRLDKESLEAARGKSPGAGRDASPSGSPNT